MDYSSFFITAFTTIFIIVDPPGNIPMFIALTETISDEDRDKISKKATLIAAFLLIFVTLTGNSILEFFKISMDGLKIAGGILLFAVSVDILMGSRRRQIYVEKGKENIDIDSLAVFPIALPLYTGPGAITAAIVLYSSAETVILKLLVIASILLTYLVVRLTHIYSNQIIRILGKSGSDIVARLMAIFLAAIAVEYFFSGIEGKLSSFVKG
jgi:multiple antibiotic resistance protein